MYSVYALAGLCRLASANLVAVCCPQSAQAYLKNFRSASVSNTRCDKSGIVRIIFKSSKFLYYEVAP
jgi:hypothetical protein